MSEKGKDQTLAKTQVTHPRASYSFVRCNTDDAIVAKINLHCFRPCVFGR